MHRRRATSLPPGPGTKPFPDVDPADVTVDPRGFRARRADEARESKQARAVTTDRPPGDTRGSAAPPRKVTIEPKDKKENTKKSWDDDVKAMDKRLGEDAAKVGSRAVVGQAVLGARPAPQLAVADHAPSAVAAVQALERRVGC